MRKALALGTLALAVAGSAFAATPATAADTTVTFTAGTPGGLSILPAAATVGVPVGNTVTATVATVITDLRVTSGTWAASAYASNFNLVGATTPSGTSQVPAANAKLYATSVTVAVPGTASVTNSHTDSASALVLSTTGQGFVTAATTNANVTTLAETLEIDVTGKALGAYSGTLSQTVS